MSRPQKAVVDYFPHSCTHGKTLFIVESKYGLIGYAIWFKLLEHLGRAESHYLNCSEYSSWAYLVAQIGTDEKTLSDLLDLLSNLGAIDSLLWSHKIIASENFITNLAFLYQKRTIETPSIESIRRINGINDTGNPQSKVKESKEEKTSSSDDQALLWWNTIASASDGAFRAIKSMSKKRREEFTKLKIIERKDEIEQAINQSDFIRHTNWFDFDWILKEENLCKLIEGKFRREGAESEESREDYVKRILAIEAEMLQQEAEDKIRKEAKEQPIEQEEEIYVP